MPVFMADRAYTVGGIQPDQAQKPDQIFSVPGVVDSLSFYTSHMGPPDNGRDLSTPNY